MNEQVTHTLHTKDKGYSFWAGVTSVDSTNPGLNILNGGVEGIPESSKKHNLNIPQIGNYGHSIYIVFNIIYIAFRL